MRRPFRPLAGAGGVRNQVNHAFGEGGHTANHGASIFPDLMRWLRKDYEPKEPAAHRRPGEVPPGKGPLPRKRG